MEGIDFASTAGETPWAVIWKEADTSCFRDFLLTFGLSVSAEQALEKVLARLEGDPVFRRRHSGGTFYPVPLHMSVENPRRPG